MTHTNVLNIKIKNIYHKEYNKVYKKIIYTFYNKTILNNNKSIRLYQIEILYL